MSEETDAMVVIVSEETGKISIAYKGNLERGLSGDEVTKRLMMIQNKPVEGKKIMKIVKGPKDGKKTD